MCRVKMAVHTLCTCFLSSLSHHFTVDKVPFLGQNTIHQRRFMQKGTVMKKVCTALMVTTVVHACIADADPALEKRVEQLEIEVAELKASLAPVIAKATGCRRSAQ